MKLIVHEYQGVEVRQRADGYFSLTDMAKAAGRRVRDWRVLDSTQEFLAALSVAQKREISLLMESRQGSDDGSGTWAHPQVAHQFAMWCSPVFAVQVTAWTESLRVNGFAIDERRPDALRGLIREELHAFLQPEAIRGLIREEVRSALRGDTRRQLGTSTTDVVLRAGETVHRDGSITIGTPARGDYLTVSDVLRVQRIAVPQKQRHALGRRVSNAYRVEAPRHREDSTVWPADPINVPRAGNYYPPQTWTWLTRSVVDAAGSMGYLPQRLCHQSTLFSDNAGGPQ